MQVRFLSLVSVYFERAPKSSLLLPDSQRCAFLTVASRKTKMFKGGKLKLNAKNNVAIARPLEWVFPRALLSLHNT